MGRRAIETAASIFGAAMSCVGAGLAAFGFASKILGSLLLLFGAVLFFVAVPAIVRLWSYSATGLQTKVTKRNGPGPVDMSLEVKAGEPLPQPLLIRVVLSEPVEYAYVSFHGIDGDPPETLEDRFVRINKNKLFISLVSQRMTSTKDETQNTKLLIGLRSNNQGIEFKSTSWRQGDLH